MQVEPNTEEPKKEEHCDDGGVGKLLVTPGLVHCGVPASSSSAQGDDDEEVKGWQGSLDDLCFQKAEKAAEEIAAAARLAQHKLS